MNRLSILASMLAMACLPMMAQKTGSKVQEKPDPNFQIYLCFGQSRQRFASVKAISLVKPMFTSSVRVVARYTGSNSGILTRSIAVRPPPCRHRQDPLQD